MISISKGIIIRLIKNEKRIVFPLKFSLENANAPKIVVNVVHNTEKNITIKELKKYFPNGAIENAFLKFSKLNDEGKSFGGNIIISALVLKAPKIIQMNGNIIINEPTIKKKYMNIFEKKSLFIFLTSTLSHSFFVFILEK